jgi:uncharacterized protein (DUF1778 family)
MAPKLTPIFRTDRNQPELLSEAAQYARELYRANFKMQMALREASKLYGVDIHKIASSLNIKKSKRRKGLDVIQ